MTLKSSWQLRLWRDSLHPHSVFVLFFLFSSSVSSQIQALWILLYHSLSFCLDSKPPRLHHLFHPISDWKCMCLHCLLEFQYFHFYMRAKCEGTRKWIELCVHCFRFQSAWDLCSENNLYAFLLDPRLEVFPGSWDFTVLNHSTFLSLYRKYYATCSLLKIQCKPCKLWLKCK